MRACEEDVIGSEAPSPLRVGTAPDIYCGIGVWPEHVAAARALLRFVAMKGLRTLANSPTAFAVIDDADTALLTASVDALSLADRL